MDARCERGSSARPARQPARSFGLSMPIARHPTEIRILRIRTDFPSQPARFTHPQFAWCAGEVRTELTHRFPGVPAVCSLPTSGRKQRSHSALAGARRAGGQLLRHRAPRSASAAGASRTSLTSRVRPRSATVVTASTATGPANTSWRSIAIGRVRRPKPPWARLPDFGSPGPGHRKTLSSRRPPRRRPAPSGWRHADASR